MLKTLLTIFHLELILLLRRSSDWLYPICFFLILLTLFPLAFSPEVTRQFFPGCIWIAALLASLLSIQNFFTSDLEDGHLSQLLFSRTPLSVLFIAKLAANWLVTALPLVLLTPLFGSLFHLSTATLLAATLSLLLGTPLLTCVGCLGMTLTIGLRQQGVLLALLMLPLTAPVLIFGVGIVQQAEAGLSFAGPLAFLAGLFVFALTIMPWAIASVVRMGLDD